MEISADGGCRVARIVDFLESRTVDSASIEIGWRTRWRDADDSLADGRRGAMSGYAAERRGSPELIRRDAL